MQSATTCAGRERAALVHYTSPAVTAANKAGKPSKHLANDMSCARSSKQAALVLARQKGTSPLTARDAPNVAPLLAETLAEPVERGRAVSCQSIEDRLVVVERQRCLDRYLTFYRVGDLVRRRRKPLGSKHLRKKEGDGSSEADAGDTHRREATRIAVLDEPSRWRHSCSRRSTPRSSPSPSGSPRGSARAAAERRMGAPGIEPGTSRV
jgi:hypothetical protein